MKVKDPMEMRASYHRQFDFGEFNQDVNEEKDDGDEDKVDVKVYETEQALKIELNELKAELKHEKAKTRKYKKTYQKLKIKLEKTPYDQRLNGQVLAAKEKVKEHMENYQRIHKKVKVLQNKLKLL